MTTWVAPLSIVKSSSIHAVWMLKCEVGQRLGDLGQRRVDVPAGAVGVRADVVHAHVEHDRVAAERCVHHLQHDRVLDEGANAMSLLMRLKIRCDRPSSKSDGMWMKLMHTSSALTGHGVSNSSA